MPRSGFSHMPLSEARRAPGIASHTASVSSSGVTNWSQLCVPTGTIRATCSAPTMAIAYERGVRLMVDRTMWPCFGFASAPRLFRNPCLSVTCSTTSRLVTTSYCPACAASAESASTLDTTYSGRFPRLASSASRLACAFAASTVLCARSTPVDFAPSLAIASTSRPPPHPTSTCESPSRGRMRPFSFSTGVCASLIKPDSDETMNVFLKGPMACSGPIAPAGSHQASPGSANIDAFETSTDADDATD
mmetsp:Transcript_9135/g.23279  ORF Transcript_9135/g.23279 Transcript_9135/m.23279 type:complete len:248 (-) Transcript_9135:173-916(-)